MRMGRSDTPSGGVLRFFIKIPYQKACKMVDAWVLLISFVISGRMESILLAWFLLAIILSSLTPNHLILCMDGILIGGFWCFNFGGLKRRSVFAKGQPVWILMGLVLRIERNTTNAKLADE